MLKLKDPTNCKAYYMWAKYDKIGGKIRPKNFHRTRKKFMGLILSSKIQISLIFATNTQYNA